MKMTSIAAAALSFIALTGCNMGGPRIYRVTIDESPVKQPLPPECYLGNTVPSSSDQRQFFRRDMDWALWDGADGKQQYLDLGSNVTWALGNAPRVEIDGPIEGPTASADKTFVGIRTRINPVGNDRTDTRRTQVTITFSDYSNSPVGTIGLQGQYLCQGTGCPMTNNDPETRSCLATLNFVARKIEVSNVTVYPNGG